MGYRRKVARRDREGKGFYRHAKSTLKQRNKKKLLEKTTWYRDRVEDDGDENVEMPKSVWKGKGWKKEKRDAELKKGDKRVEVKAVMFVPFTTGSKLAKEIREAEEKLGGMTGYRLKVVEKSGNKLEDLLTRSNP